MGLAVILIPLTTSINGDMLISIILVLFDYPMPKKQVVTLRWPLSLLFQQQSLSTMKCVHYIPLYQSRQQFT